MSEPKEKKKRNVLLDSIKTEITAMMKTKENPDPIRMQLLDKAMKLVALEEKLNEDEWGDFFKEEPEKPE